MVWATGGKVGDLYRVNEIWKKEGYHSLLQRMPYPLKWSQFPLNNRTMTQLQTMAEPFREQAVRSYSGIL